MSERTSQRIRPPVQRVVARIPLCVACWLCVLLASGVGLVSPTFAAPLGEDEAVVVGREALSRSDSFPWYDADADAVRRLDVAPPKDFENRGSQWERKNIGTLRQMPAWLWKGLEILGWTLLLIALVAVSYLLVRVFLLTEAGGTASGLASEQAEDSGGIDRVDSLPFQLTRPQTDLLSEARRLYEAGNYAAAIIYLYSYQLVELDKHQFIRLTKGKTNRQYLRELRRQGDLLGLLRTTMLAFEDVFFGNHALDRARFESCWSGLDAFHHRLAQVNP